MNELIPISELPKRVTIADFDMKFTSMVLFMVKWALATIPAAIILAIFGGAVFMALMALGAAMSGH